MTPDFRQALLDIHGPAADAWLAALPSLLGACARRWRLTLEAPFAPLTYGYVVPGVRDDGTAVVLKAAPPGRGLSAERAALAAFGGRGAVELIDADEVRGVLLLRRIGPGTSLLALVESDRDDEATWAAAGVIRALHRPVEDSGRGPSDACPPSFAFPTVQDWAGGFERLRARFDGGTGPLPARLVAMAEEGFAALLASSAPAVLLHGDLHHGNVLATDSGDVVGAYRPAGESNASWLAIDPQGVVGEPAYEVGAMLRNPLPWLLAGGQRRARAVSARRIAILAEALGVERRRLAAWGAAQAVLSAWWSVEDHGAGWEGAVEVARVLGGLQRRSGFIP